MVCFKMSVKKIYTCLSIFAFMPWGAFAQSAAASALSSDKTAPSVRILKPLPQTQGSVDDLKERLQDLGPRGDDKMILDLGSIFSDKKEVMGPRTGGGGNSCSLAIVENVTRLTGMLDAVNAELLSSEDTEKVRAAIKKTKFFVADRLVLNGQVKDAINYPREGAVVLSKNFCDTEMIEPSGRSMSLLLHEFLGLARIDDRQYQISRQFLSRYAEVISEDFKLRKRLELEAAKDLKGESTCFKGQIKRKDAEMFESYGGRYSQGEVPGITLQLIEEENYRQMDKYCHGFLDKNKKPVDTREKAAYELCHGSFSSTYVVSAAFNFSTSGTYGQESVLTLVKFEKNLESVVDLNYEGDGIPVISTRDVGTEFTCKNLKLP